MITLERAILQSSTIRQLKADAKLAKIFNYSRLSKAELINRLEAYELWKQEINSEYRAEFPILAEFKPVSEFKILEQGIRIRILEVV